MVSAGGKGANRLRVKTRVEDAGVVRFFGVRKTATCADQRYAAMLCQPSGVRGVYVDLVGRALRRRGEFPPVFWNAVGTAAIRCNVRFVIEAIKISSGTESANLELIVVTPGTSKRTPYTLCIDSEQVAVTDER